MAINQKPQATKLLIDRVHDERYLGCDPKS